MKEDIGKIMDKRDFLSHGLFDKEHYEGLIISARPEGGYNIGIQVGHDKVMKVDEADFTNVRNKIYEWAPQVQRIQKRFAEPADLQNYDEFDDDEYYDDMI